MKKVIQLQGLDCAHCAAELEDEIAKIQGGHSATVVFVSQKLTVEYDDEKTLKNVIYTVNHFEEVSVVEESEQPQKQGGMSATKVDNEDETKRKKHAFQWWLIAISAVCFCVGAVCEYFSSTQPMFTIIYYIAYAVSYIAVGYPVLWATCKNVIKGKIFDENFLMTIASVGAVILGEIGEGVAVMLLYQIGETLQGMAVRASRRSISSLMQLKSEYANKLVGATQEKVPAESIVKGDVLLVKTGEKIPVDGQLLSSFAVLDTKSLTGEAEPKTAKLGEELLSGCINMGNAFYIKALRPYNQSAVAKIIDMVENASAGKAAPEKFITRFAKYYTPIVCLLALGVAVVAPLFDGLFTNGMLYFKDFARWAHSALTFLVVSCPCALIISVPLTYFSGIGACAKQGILVKGATYLDTLAKAQNVAFDKTGTLTKGNFVIVKTHAQDSDTQRLLSLAAAVESHSAHPIAKAFSKIKTHITVTDVVERAGRGLSASIDGNTLLVGNADWLTENGVQLQPIPSINTLVYVAENGKFLGAIEIGDEVRSDAKQTIERLKALGITRTAMLTGDNAARAQKIASDGGVYELNAQLLPDEKLKKAEELKKDGVLLYVGDGINDAPVMVAADCAVSMGKLGSAAAVEASELVLISDRLSAIADGIRIAKKTRTIVMQNIVFSITMKIVFMVLGAIGILPLWLAVFADVGVMLLAVIHSLRVRK